tara:strand:+ start:410 stop:607 length:198 start_codon:yes stop_codon:yes gene_type:complete
MLVGDLVRWREKTAVIIRVFEHKIWRTNELGSEINFDKIRPEPFAEILIKGKTHKVPQIDLELIK